MFKFILPISSDDWNHDIQRTEEKKFDLNTSRKGRKKYYLNLKFKTMTKQNTRVNVIKVPLSQSSSSNPPLDNKSAPFPRMPRMYLELLENKDKIKPSMVNQEYDPDEVETQFSYPIRPQPPEGREGRQEQGNESGGEMYDNDDREEEGYDESNNEGGDGGSTNSHEVASDVSSISSSPSYQRKRKNEDDDNNDNDNSIDNDEDGEEEINDDTDRRKDNRYRHHRDDDERSLPSVSCSSSSSFRSVSRSSSPVGDNNSLPSSSSSMFSSSSRAQRGGERHGGRRGERGRPSSQLQSPGVPPVHHHSAAREKLRQILNPPKLSELEKQGEVHTTKVIPNIGQYTLEQEDELKRELLYKYDILRRSYKKMDIPDFSMHSDYKTMNRTYQNTLRRISLDNNVEQYKNYMVVGFMIMEYLLGTWFKLDMSGFTQQQLLNMSQYERLLIELGEKSYVPAEKQWPVEVRLLGLVLLNTVVFLIAKIMINKTGTNLFGLLQTTNAFSPLPHNNNNNNTSSSAKQQQSYTPGHGENRETTTGSSSSSSSFFHPPDKMSTAKRRMKGPSIDLHSIPDLSTMTS